MRTPRTPGRWRRELCGVPSVNHEVYTTTGGWKCHRVECLPLFTFAEATAHIVAYQFDARRDERAMIVSETRRG
jgi:hypothetical protein